MEIQSIDESLFNKIDGIRQIIAHDHARRFALINLNEIGDYGISWRSDLIEPIVTLSYDQLTTWIGVDRQLAAIEINHGRISVALSLTSNIVQILALPSLTAVLTELELLLFNMDKSIRCIKGLPDISSQISAYGKNLVIKSLEGDNLILDIETGIFKESIITS